MIESAGNDIIDLAAINTERTKQQRFYTKFITGTETSLYSPPPLAALPFEYFVWMLWSIKESVYKFMQRHQPDLVFSPSKIVIRQIAPSVNSLLTVPELIVEALGFSNRNVYNSEIIFGTDVFYASTVITTGYIHTVANDQNNFDNLYWGVKLISQTDPFVQSREVRKFILDRLALVTGKENLNIVKNQAACPVLYSGTAAIDQPVSLAHHGHYVAYVFLQNNIGKSLQ
jgi:phosphopantetheinyl transferase (holo-ACP synthase)